MVAESTVDHTRAQRAQRWHRRLDFVTRNFDSLKGLYAIPFGLLALLLAALRAGFVTIEGTGEWGPAAIASALLLSLGATKLYYDRRFGHAVPHPKDAAYYVQLTLFRALGVTALFVPLATRTGGWLSLALPFVLLALGVNLQRHALIFRAHWAVLAALVAVASPLLPAELTLSLALRLTVVGGYFVVCGLLDHWLLVRMLKPLLEERHDTTTDAKPE
jgi:hypothetical protein